MKSIKKIDIHEHSSVFAEWIPRERNSEYHILSPEELLKIYDELNIEKGVLLPLLSPEVWNGQITNENCKMIAEQYPDRFLWFCNIDPRMETEEGNWTFDELFAHYKKLGAKGLGELTANLSVDDPRMDTLFFHCEKENLPVMIHISPKVGFSYGIVDELGLPKLDAIMTKYPDLKIIGHSQAFWSEISADNTEAIRWTNSLEKVREGRLAEMLRKHPNLYCDLSASSGAIAMIRDEEYAIKFIEEFADRILYGCDVCAAHNRQQYVLNDWLIKMVDEEKISCENYRKIVRENAIKLLQLDKSEENHEK